MNLAEVDLSVKKLSALDTYRRLKDENVRAEYMQSLMSVAFHIFNAAFAQLKVTFSELPSIQDIISLCRRLQGRNDVPRAKCELCGGKGYVEIRERLVLRERASVRSGEQYEAGRKEYDMTYRCSCRNAEKWPEILPGGARYKNFSEVYLGLSNL